MMVDVKRTDAYAYTHTCSNLQPNYRHTHTHKQSFEELFSDIREISIHSDLETSYINVGLCDWFSL